MAEINIKIEGLTITSEQLGREVECILYIPEVEGLAAPLHLFLVNDGQDLEPMQYDQILETLYRKTQIHPVLTVGIKAGDRLREFGIAGTPDYKGRGADSEKYRAFVLQELLPAIKEKTGIEEFASCVIKGFSLGAVSAFDIAWNNPDVFSKVGAFSGSFWWRSKPSMKGYPDMHRIAHKMVSESTEKRNLKFWFEAGTQDEKSDRNQNGIIDSIDDTTSLIKELYNKGYERKKDVTYVELVGGRHDVPTWGKMMPEFLTWAFGR